MIKIYGVNTWSSVRKAVSFFKQKNINHQVIDLKREVPTKEEIKLFHEDSGLDIKNFFNTNGKVYKELGLKDKLDSLTLDEKYGLLVNNGMLIKRPLVVDIDKIVLGYKEDSYIAIWG